MTRLVYLNTAPLCDDGSFDDLYAALSPFRREKTDRFRFRKDKNLSLGAGAALDALLRREGLRERDMKYGEGKNGKPFFENAPELRFNISHSGNIVLVAFSDAETGCDVEMMKETDGEIAKRFFCRREYDDVASAEDTAERFFRYWTLKESFVKATGLGMELPFDTFGIELGEKITVTGGIGGVFSFFEYGEIPGYRAALCVTGREEPRPELEKIEIC